MEKQGQNWEVTCSRPLSESELGFQAQARWTVEPPSFIFISLPLIGQEARAQLPGTRHSWLQGSGWALGGSGASGSRAQGGCREEGARLAWGQRARVGDSSWGVLLTRPSG